MQSPGAFPVEFGLEMKDPDGNSENLHEVSSIGEEDGRFFVSTLADIIRSGKYLVPFVRNIPLSHGL